MAESQLDEAKRCPKCQQPGEQQAGYELVKEGRHRGAKVHTFICQNEDCVWYKTGWVLQINPDGSIPVRKKGQKEHPEMNEFQKAMARRELEQLSLSDPAVGEVLKLDPNS